MEKTLRVKVTCIEHFLISSKIKHLCPPTHITFIQHSIGAEKPRCYGRSTSRTKMKVKGLNLLIFKRYYIIPLVRKTVIIK